MAIKKKLYSIKLEGTNSDGEDDYLYYDVYEPTEGVHDILNSKDLPKKDQKWVRPTFPIFEYCTKHENIELYKREIKRMTYGVYFYNNGKLTYVTGVHYAAMVHWKLKESDVDYFKYTRTQRDIFYFMDLCAKDTKCVGGIVFSLKRLGKSEIMQIEMFVDALLSEHGRYIFQGLNYDEARENFAKTFYANEHLHESLPITFWDETKVTLKKNPKENLLIFLRETLTNGIVWRAIDGKSSTDNIDFGVKPTKLSAIQGKKIRRAALDEFASLEKKDEMTLSNWHSKAHAQTTQDSGSVVVGKMWLIATAENINSDSLDEAKQIWDDSAPNKIDANGFTPSGLKRMFIPFYLGGRGGEFMDEYGEPRIDIAIKFWENRCNSLSDAARIKYQHENPKTIEHVFNIDKNVGLELDVIEIIKHRKKELTGKPQFKYTIKRINGEIIVEPAEKSEYDGQFTFEMFEPPLEHHKYRIGVDATSTAKNSTNKNEAGKELGKEKSKFALVVYKITGDNQYVDVANFFVRPEKRHLVEKTALYICMYYNKFGGARAYPERNASAGSTLTDLFEGEGQQRILLRQLRSHNIDKIIEKSGDAYGIYIDGNNKDYRTSAMNKFYRLFGYKINSLRLCENLLIYGTDNADLADAAGVGVLSCGNFEPDKQVKKKSEPQPQQTMKYQMNEKGQIVRVWA